MAPVVAATLRTEEMECEIPRSAELERAARRWAYIARNRRRWLGWSGGREKLGKRCWDQLMALKVTEEALASVATFTLTELSMPTESLTDGLGARLMPWEFVINEAIQSEYGHSATTIRHLDREFHRRAYSPVNTVAVVLGATAALEPHFTFDEERKLGPRILGGEVLSLDDLTESDLARSIGEESPDVIHVGGVDNHQGTRLLEMSTDVDFGDGLVLSDDIGTPTRVNAENVAKIMTAGQRPPSLVAFNLHHSATNTAAFTVAKGADVAIGFQDSVDDLMAELFFGQFYRAWVKSEGNPLVAFHVALDALRESPDPLSGVGVVMWTAESLVGMGIEALRAESAWVVEKLTEQRQNVVAFKTEEEARAGLPVQVEPREKLNYGLLHNRERMFRTFEVRNVFEDRQISDVRVNVEMFAGTERLPYVSTFPIGNAPLSLDDKIFIPLTSALARSLQESVRASLRVNVSVGSNISLYERTHQVTLLPTNEWVDDDESRQWLPSFVFPKDPAIQKVLSAGERFLPFLLRDPAAGFDGYQSVDNTDENPTHGVDCQVEAIWSALLHTLPLGYINPPPTFTPESQRLRNPSDVLEGGRGTCIDLALLLAACLEYVNIFPVIFLLNGHAFPGYWRSEEVWANFVNLNHTDDLEVDELDELLAHSDRTVHEYAWLFPAGYHREIMAQIEAGNLVPLETVWLTTKYTFDEAQDGGWENLQNASEFHSLVDIALARLCDVTPIPVEFG